MFLCKYDLLIAAILLSLSSYPIPPHPYVAFELMLGYQAVSSLDNCFHPSELEEKEHRKRITNEQGIQNRDIVTYQLLHVQAT